MCERRINLQFQISDKKLNKVIMDAKKLRETVGLEMTRKILQRFNEINSSPNFFHYVEYGLGKPHPLTCNLDKLYGISLNKNYRLVVEPLVEALDDDSLKECKIVDIKGVVDYHGRKYNWIIP